MVTLTKFGTFTTYESKGRNGRNPQTGETIHIPTKERIKFKPYESLKKAVEGEPDE
jgi:nucleoid DNA-binding protein